MLVKITRQLNFVHFYIMDQADSFTAVKMTDF